MADQVFKVGAVVKLKIPNDLKMTVETMTFDDAGVVWFDEENVLHRAILSLEALEVVG